MAEGNYLPLMPPLLALSVSIAHDTDACKSEEGCLAGQLDIEMTVLKQPWDGTGGELYRTGSTIVRTIRLVDPIRSLERISIALPIRSLDPLQSVATWRSLLPTESCWWAGQDTPPTGGRSCRDFHQDLLSYGILYRARCWLI